MTIRLADVHQSAIFRGTRIPLLKGLDLEVPTGARIILLGLPKSGKTTLLRIMCGTATPDHGSVVRTSPTSWPIPLTTFIAPTPPVSRAIRFLARLYGVTDAAFPRRIAEMVDIAEFLNVPLNKCPRNVKPRLAFALGIGLDFDTYLFDGSLTPVDKDFKERAGELIAKRLEGRGYVLASANPKEGEQDCDSVYVLEAGQVRYFATPAEGVEYFKQLLAAQKQKEVAAKELKQEETGDEENEGLGDIDMVGAAIADEVE